MNKEELFFLEFVYEQQKIWIRMQNTLQDET
jgi:hypothetical protein